MTVKRFAVFALAGALCASPVAAQSVAQLLEKGIYAEETVGDLDAAIQIYRQILTARVAPRDIVAQAQFHLTESLRRKGEPPSAAPGVAQIPGDPCCGILSQNYDPSRPVVVTGTVTQVQWVNPQSLVFVDGIDGNKYGFAILAPNALIRLGLDKTWLKPGEQVNVTGFLAVGAQLIDGKPAPCPSDNASLGCATFTNGAVHASGRSITSADGRNLFDREAAQKALQQQSQR